MQATETGSTAGDLRARLHTLLAHGLSTHQFSAAGVGVAVNAEVRVLETIGDLAAFDDHGNEIDPLDREPAGLETLFDLASVTKVYSAHTLLRLVEDGQLGLDEPIRRWLPRNNKEDKRAVTLRHLLTHTSGLPSTWSGWRAPLNAALQNRPATRTPLVEAPIGNIDALRANLEATPLAALPGTRWEYSCTGYNTAMLAAEQATGRKWEDLLQSFTLEPLGLEKTTTRPSRSRAAATEYQPEFQRGTIRGVVHDESSWSLGGGTANAGLFATAADVLTFAEAIRLGATGPMQSAMWIDQLDAIPRNASLNARPPFGASLGLRIGEASWMGTESRSFSVRGHTGFTGTSIAMNRNEGWSLVLLTNRVHPSRTTDGTQALRNRAVELISDQARRGIE